MMLRYPILLSRDSNETWMVTSPDFAEVGTFGEDEADASVQGAAAIATAIAGRIAASRPIPPPSPITGPFARLTTSDALKIALYDTMRASNIDTSELARRLGYRLADVTDLVDLEHETPLDRLDAALRALGREIRTEVVPAA